MVIVERAIRVDRIYRVSHRALKSTRLSKLLAMAMRAVASAFRAASVRVL